MQEPAMVELASISALRRWRQADVAWPVRGTVLRKGT